LFQIREGQNALGLLLFSAISISTLASVTRDQSPSISELRQFGRKPLRRYGGEMLDFVSRILARLGMLFGEMDEPTPVANTSASASRAVSTRR
jgi:hypothetical protein